MHSTRGKNLQCLSLGLLLNSERKEDTKCVMTTVLLPIPTPGNLCQAPPEWFMNQWGIGRILTDRERLKMLEFWDHSDNPFQSTFNLLPPSPVDNQSPGLYGLLETLVFYPLKNDVIAHQNNIILSSINFYPLSTSSKLF